ncbi:hypothetical protein [Algisphaera agarilytica]|uniref:Uncharacterized protein n=1 Tax=Algisphaera agarilytica TaxID=1385975 RepID=A0A7X0H3V9_9BACT|nr:hypothetical protein [Algisphaera agarilytica]MBB6428765.1 hypothetical protein [Algisphaera agarilytica]
MWIAKQRVWVQAVVVLSAMLVAGPALADVNKKRQTLRIHEAKAKAALAEGDWQLAGKFYRKFWRERYVNKELGMNIHSDDKIQEMIDLVALHVKPRQYFASQRDQLAGNQPYPFQDDALVDWMVLNRVVGEQERSLLWFDQAVLDETKSDQVKLTRRFLETDLMEAGRWSDLQHYYPDPLGSITQCADSYLRGGILALYAKSREHHGGTMSAEDRERVTKNLARSYDRKVAIIYAVLVASGQDELSVQAWDLIMEHQDRPETRVAVLGSVMKSGSLSESDKAKLEGVPVGTPGLMPIQDELDRLFPESTETAEPVQQGEDASEDEAAASSEGEASAPSEAESR